jgi:hypothetical protein
VSGQAVTFTATVSPIPSGGTVDFVIDGNPAASGLPLNGMGQASFMTSALTVAGSPHTVTANYSGNPIFGPSSGSLAGGQTVNAPGTGSPQNWTSAGSIGAVDEDSIGKLTNQDFVVGFAAGQTGTATVRYNITATKGITAFCPATQSTVSVRFRNSDITGLHTRVKFEIRRTNITSGGNQIIYTFNSDGLSNGSNFLLSTATPAIDFDFASNVYWIEATIFRDDPNLFADLGLIQIFESAGTPCP